MVEDCNEESDSFSEFKKQFEAKSNEELLKGLYGFIYSESLKRYKNANSIDYSGLEVKGERGERGERGDRGERGANGAQSGYERFHISLGKENGLDTGSLIKLVSRNYSLKGSDIGKISILSNFAFFEVPEGVKEKLIQTTNVTWKGEGYSIRVATPSSESRGRGNGGGSSRGGNRSRPRTRSGASASGSAPRKPSTRGPGATRSNSERSSSDRKQKTFRS